MRAAALLFLAVGWVCAQEPLTIDVDVRNRFVTGDSGQTYRSIVNLSEGLRLYSADVLYQAKDRIDLSVHNWGDPDSDLLFKLSRPQWYDVDLRYSTLAYFNNLFSYANPLLAQGVMTSQQAIDLRRRQLDFDFRFKPRSRITPFLSVLRTSGDGHGITPFVGSGDEFPVPTTFSDTMTTVRGGLEFRARHWSAVIEEGRTGYDDEQNLDSGFNPGNRPDTLVLNQLTERYRGSGAGWFSRGVFQADPLKQLAFSGHFIYSHPHMNVTHDLGAQGVFSDPNTLRPYTSLVEESIAGANQPHTSGSWSTEFRPLEHWRIRNNWYSDAFQVSAASPTTPMLTTAQAARGMLNLRYDQSETEISGDIGNILTIRGGYRYVRSDADLPPPSVVYPLSPTDARIRRHVALAGATLTLWKGRARVHTDYERSPGGETYFRTGLQDYYKFSIQGRIRLTNTLQITAVHKTLSNHNIGIDYSNSQTAMSVEWTPDHGKRLTFVGDYSRETIRSNAIIINPTDFQPAFSNYDDRGNHANGYAELRLMGGAVLHAGGAISDTVGTRPTRYYNPQGRLTVPVTRRVGFVAEWRWYDFHSVEEFRTHTVSMGAQIRIGALQAARK
jgi:hypothetical protein